MKIGIDARVVTLSELRGMGTYLEQVLKFWPDKADEFVLFTNHEPELGKKRLPDVNGEWIEVKEPKGSRFHVYDWLALPRAIRRVNLDLFWSPANVSLPIKHIPQIVTIHDTLLQEKVSHSTNLDKWYFNVLQPYLTRNFADKVITVSKFSAERIYKTFSFPKNCIHVIHNGMSGNNPIFRAKQDAQNFLAAKEIRARNFIYCLGAESPWKNTRRLLEAFALIANQNPSLSLVVSGIQQRSMRVFRDYVSTLDIDEERVHLLGFVKRDVRDALYMSCECFVYPSLFEGFGFPPLEAMQLGAPVVASNAASIPEVVGNAAVLVNASNQEKLAKEVLNLVSNHELSKHLLENSKGVISRYNWKNCSKLHCGLFNKVRCEIKECTD